MFKKISVTLGVILLLGVGWTWVALISPLREAADKYGPDSAARDYALQDNTRIQIPTLSETPPLAPHYSQHNLYWGELHVHTAESFDATLFGNTLTIEDAYRFARGEPLETAGGEIMRLSRPLDFVAITDHAEGFGTRTHCGDSGLTIPERAACWLVNEPNPRIFQILVGRARGKAEAGDPTLPAGVYQQKARSKLPPGSFPTCRFGENALERCINNATVDWTRYVSTANDYYEPGVLTTLIGYEFSPGLPNQGKHHRNVIFRSDTVPERALSSLDVSNALELWRGLDDSCRGDCEFLTIPHNSNKAWGLTYSRYTWDGKEYTDSDWKLRKKHEPIAEIFQIKGAQECALGVGATDEECAFEQVFTPCQSGETTGCAFTTGFVRQGLKVGLELERELGFNPLQTGFIAATDSHNSNPGDVEEWDFPGATGAISSSAYRRLEDDQTEAFKSRLQFHTSGGLAAVWAPENNREAIFDALARRETYATSGPRIGLRFHAAWDIEEELLRDGLFSLDHDQISVPMGGVLTAPKTKGSESDKSPSFFVWATRDPLDAPLHRIQMVKGWIDSTGSTQERVVDIACAGGLAVNPSSGQCPENDATVDLETCQYSTDSGAGELQTFWRDPDYQADQSTFYYVRVLMNPTCRWSTYDAIRLGRQPDPRVPATIEERAWSSPIWITPNSQE